MPFSTLNSQTLLILGRLISFQNIGLCARLMSFFCLVLIKEWLINHCWCYQTLFDADHFLPFSLSKKPFYDTLHLNVIGSC